MNNKGYKAFDKGLICRGYQFKENTIFEEEYANPCIRGFHYCKNPIDVLRYYDLVDHNGNLREFAEVEALDEELTDDNIKYCTKKIKIGEKLSLNEFIQACIDYESSDGSNNITTSDDFSNIVTSGYFNKIATSGDFSNITTSGCSSKIVTSGGCSNIATSGHYNQIATSGNYSNVVTNGCSSNIVTIGNYSEIIMQGKNNVGANIGVNGLIKGKIGDWITLAEYNESEDMCICVKSAQIDGVELKEDVFYKLENGEFVEA